MMDWNLMVDSDFEHFREQQAGFLWPVEQSDFYCMSEPFPTFTQSFQNEMGRCVICDGNHPSEQCIYLSEVENYQNSLNEELAYYPEPYFSSLPPSTFDLQQPEPSEEDQIVEMLNNWLAERESQFQSQAESIQRITDQVRQLTENMNCIPHEANDTNEAFNDENLSTGEAEEAEITIQEPEPEQSRFDFYYSDSDDDEPAEIFVPTKVEDEFLYPQNEDLGDSIAQMFEEDLPKPITQEAVISQMTDAELDAEILKYICEDNVEQDAGEMEKFGHSGETSLFGDVQITDINQKFNFLSEIIGATKLKKEAQAQTVQFILPPYCWKRPFKSNAHGVVFNRTTKATLKPP